MMYVPRPIINRTTPPAEVISLELVKEFIGLDSDIDAEQDKVLPVLISAAVEQGEQITGIVWGAATYTIDDLYNLWSCDWFTLPLSPVFDVTDVSGRDGSGQAAPLDPDSYSLIPSAIDLGRPWAELRPNESWPGAAVTLSVTCRAG